ncbi:Polycomb group ring finger [Chamberlinius hualienensis]
MHGATRIKITDLNPHLTCQLCGGYYIDATTIIECLHSFCKTCIVKYLENNKHCPVCEVQIHKTKPLRNIKSDTTLQDMVYKLVPGLFKSEMKRRRDFYSAHPEEAALVVNLEDRGEVHENRFIYTPDEDISLSLEYWDGESEHSSNGDDAVKDEQVEKIDVSETVEKNHRRFLRAPAAVTISHIKKFIRYKYGFTANYAIDVVHESEVLSDDYTLIDVAYIYSWRRNGPMKLKYRIEDPKVSNPSKKLKTSHNSDASSEIDLNRPPTALPNSNNKSGGTAGGDEAKSLAFNNKSGTATKVSCPPPQSTQFDDKQKSASESLCRTSTPMELDLRPPLSVTVTPIVTPLVNGNSNANDCDKSSVEVVNIGGKDGSNKAVVEIMIKSSVTIEPVVEKSSTPNAINDKDNRSFTVHTPEPPTQEVVITKVITDDNSSSVTSRTPTPKDSIEIKPAKIVPISTKDVTVKEITTSTTIPNDNGNKDGVANNNSVVVVMLASKEPPEIPVTSNGNSNTCHSNGTFSTSSCSAPVLPVPDISITPIPLWTTPNPPTSSTNTCITPVNPRSSSSSAAIVRDTLKTTSPQVEIIKKVATITDSSSSAVTSTTPSITTLTPVMMNGNSNGNGNVGNSPSITISPSPSAIITTSATDTTINITITSPPVKPSSTSAPSLSTTSTSSTPVTVTTPSSSSSGVSSGTNGNGEGNGEEDDSPKHDNIGALDLSRNSRGSHSPQSPRSPRSFVPSPVASIVSTTTSVSTNGGCMLPPVSTMCFTSPSPSNRLPSQTQARAVASKSITLLSPAAGAASITTITVPVPNAHSRTVVNSSTCSTPHHQHSIHSQTPHGRSSHIPINSAHLGALKPSPRNCLNGVVAATTARSLQLQQQHSQHHHHHHHHNLHHQHLHGSPQQSQQSNVSHHYQNKTAFAKNILPFGASKTAKKITEQVRHRASFDKPSGLPSSSLFHNGDKVIDSGTSASTTI